MIQWNKVSNNEVVISLIQLREEIEKKIQKLDKSALINYEIEKLNETDESQLPQQDVDKLGNEDVPKLGYDVEKLAKDTYEWLNNGYMNRKSLPTRQELRDWFTMKLGGKETLYTEEQVREAMKFARTFNSAIRDIDYIKSLKQGGDK